MLRKGSIATRITKVRWGCRRKAIHVFYTKYYKTKKGGFKALEQHHRSDRLRTCVSLKVLLIDGVVWSNLHQEIEDDGCVLLCMF